MVLAMMLAALAIESSDDEDKKRPDPIEWSIEVQEEYPERAPVVVRITSVNRSEHRQLLHFIGFGLPGRARVYVSARGDAQILGRHDGAIVDHAFQGPRASRRWEPGEAIVTEIDLQSLCQLTSPGEYTVNLEIADTKATASRSFRIVPLGDKRVTDVKEKCVNPIYSDEFWSQRETNVRASITTGQIGSGDSLRTLVIVDDVFIDNYSLPRVSGPASHEFDRRATLQKAELDFRRQLWTLFESDGEQALIVFSILHGTSEVVIPWTKGPIRLDFAQMRQDSPKMILAGIEGQPQITSLRRAAGQR